MLGRSFDDAYVLCGSEDGSIHIWDLVEGKQLAQLSGHRGAVGAIACDPTKFEVLTGGVDGTVKLWTQASGPMLQK